MYNGKTLHGHHGDLNRPILISVPSEWVGKLPSTGGKSDCFGKLLDIEYLCLLRSRSACTKKLLILLIRIAQQS